MKLTAPAPTLADNFLPAWNPDSRLARLAHDAVLVLAFTGLVILCAQISVHLSWTIVPITGQTFAVLVTGGALGPWRGATSLALYMLIGMVSPVFAPSTTVLEGQSVHFILPWEGTTALPWDLPSGGYIVGFIVAAWLIGWLSRKGLDRGPWLIAGMLAANVVLYVPGLLWLAHSIDTGPERTLELGLYPFILGDLIKLYLASLTLPAAWAFVKRRRDSGPPTG